MWKFGRKGSTAGAPAADRGPARTTASSGSASVTCDVCNTRTERAGCYSLTTSTIAISEGYWRRRSELLKVMSDVLGSDERAQARMFGESLRTTAGSTTPWLVCEDCSELFVFDGDSARSHAVRGTDPSGTGPVEPGACATQAAAGWEHAFGRWPATVQRPDVTDSCDLCAKRMYGDELAGRAGRPQLDHARAVGAIEGPPLSPARPDGTWLVCGVCLGRIVARTRRATHGTGHPPERP